MKHPLSRTLFAHWRHLKGARAAPERDDLDPAALRPVLGDLFILGVEATEHPSYPVRLAGGRLQAFFGADLRGASLPGLFGGHDRAAVARLLGDVLDGQAPVVLGLTAAPPGDSRPADLEMLLLPLRHRGKTHARILGSAAPFGVPSWLGLTPVERFTLVSMRLGRGDGPEPPAEAVAAPPRRRGHLTIHEGGRAGPRPLNMRLTAGP